jgi:arachidonate 5-lipoxygenase
VFVHACDCVCYSYYALVDSLRRAPTSYCDVIYHSHVTYEFQPSQGPPLAVRFRLLPLQPSGPRERNFVESGRLNRQDQEKPWFKERHEDDTRPKDYLRLEFIERLRQDEPVKYQLQLQMMSADEVNAWHPQLVSILRLVTYCIACRTQPQRFKI